MRDNRRQHAAHSSRTPKRIPITPEEEAKFDTSFGKAKILADMVERLKQNHGFFHMDIEFGTLITFVGFLQLACTHPDIDRFQKNSVRKLVRSIFATLEKEEPGITSLLLNREGGAL